AGAGEQPVMMELNGSTAFSWWGQPELNYTLNNALLHKAAAQKGQQTVSKHEVNYAEVYSGITEQFVMLGNGIENNTIIHTLSSEAQQRPGGAMLEFSQFIPLQNGWTVDVSGQKQSGDFTADNFHIRIPGTEDGIYFGSVIVF